MNKDINNLIETIKLFHLYINSYDANRFNEEEKRLINELAVVVKFYSK